MVRWGLGKVDGLMRIGKGWWSDEDWGRLMVRWGLGKVDGLMRIGEGWWSDEDWGRLMVRWGLGKVDGQMRIGEGWWSDGDCGRLMVWWWLGKVDGQMRIWEGWWSDEDWGRLMVRWGLGKVDGLMRIGEGWWSDGDWGKLMVRWGLGKVDGLMRIWEGWWSILACSLVAVESDSCCTDPGLSMGWLGGCLLFLPPASLQSYTSASNLQLAFLTEEHQLCQSAMTGGWFLSAQAVISAGLCNVFLERHDHTFLLGVCWRRLLWACVCPPSLWRGYGHTPGSINNTKVIFFTCNHK